MFYAGAQYVTRGHSFRTYDWTRSSGIAGNIMGQYKLADSIAPAEQAA
jgi:4-hydroxyphenylacetate 3-monooxygenase